MRLGSTGAMKTPTACCANSCQKGPICQRSARRSSMISPDSSMAVRARPWIGRHPRKSWRRKLKHSQNVLHLILETSLDSKGGLIKPCLKKLFMRLHLCQSQSEKTLLTHPFGAWLLMFPDVVAGL